MTFDATTARDTRHDSSTGHATRPIFHPGPKRPHVVLFGHAEAREQLSALADILRPVSTPSVYCGDAVRVVPKSQILKAVDQAEIFVYAPSSGSCNSDSAIYEIERIVLERVVREDNPAPLAIAISANRVGLDSKLLEIHQKHVQLVVLDTQDTTGGLLDMLPGRVKIASHADDKLFSHISSVARTRMSF